MRQSFVFTERRSEAKNECPWAERIVKVCDGFMCFESEADYHTWKNQK